MLRTLLDHTGDMPAPEAARRIARGLLTALGVIGLAYVHEYYFQTLPPMWLSLLVGVLIESIFALLGW